MLRVVAPALTALALVVASPAAAATEGTLSQLPPVGSPAASGVTISPGGGNVYSVGSGALIAYARDAVTGSLAPLAGQAALTQAPDVAPVVSPDGRNAYGGGAVMNRDLVTGVLTSAGTAPGTGASVLGATAVSPDGLSVYVAAPDDGLIYAFTRDALTGALTAAGTTSTLQDIHALTLSPDGLSLYAASDEGLAVFTRAPVTGALTAAGCLDGAGAGGCTAVAGLHGPTAVAVAPDGLSVYVTVGDNGAGGVVAFTRDPASGALTQAGCVNESDSACTVNPAVANAHGVALSPDGRFAYVASFDGALVALTRDGATGALSAIAAPDGCLVDPRFGSSPCGAGSGLWMLNGVVVSPDGQNVYGSSADAGLTAFKRAPQVIVEPPHDPPVDPTPPTDPTPPADTTPPATTPTQPSGGSLPVRVIVETPHEEEPDTPVAPTLKLVSQTNSLGFRTGKLRVMLRCDRACSGIVSAYAMPKKGKTVRLAGKRVKLKKKGKLVINFRVTGKKLKLLRTSGTILQFRARAS